MNPSIDLFGVTERLVEDAKSRCRDPRREPGGGGINVARNLHRFGVEVLAVFPGGGLNGQLLEQLSAGENLPCRRIESKNETRQNFAITEETSGKLFHFVFPGPDLYENEWQACLETTIDKAGSSAYLVLSGSLSAGVPEDFFSRIARALSDKDVKVVLDTSGSALDQALGSGIYCSKLNRKEFRQLGYSGSTEDHESCLDAMQKMVTEDRLCEILIVTLGADGALLASRDGERLHAAPPPTEIVSHVGAGDAFVSILVYQLHHGKPLAEAFRYAVAAAAAAIKTPGNQLEDMDTVEQIHRQMRNE